MSWQPPSKPPLRFFAPRNGWGESRGRGVWLALLSAAALLGLAWWVR